ncbi:MAG: serine/threonine protein kinase [Gemmatimonadota bacterium]|nr:serine/threonine protein kinase [Gemmatimonadota bacterium]
MRCANAAPFNLFHTLMLDRDDPATAALIRAIAGQYSVEREVGRGGMGVVYLATDEHLRRPVAIKTLPLHLAADARVRDRFLREARTAGALSHPNIVPIYSAAERDGVVYFAMRYIKGESLAERIARNGSLPPAEVVSVLRQLASALGYAHANGVVHRDIKAENVLLDSETGRAMLTDFGIARLAETQPLTATGTVLGTVQYMSPEQVSGDELDGRSDLYSLGVLAFFALSGRFPFERPTASAIVVAHVTTMPPRMCSVMPAVSEKLGDIVDKLLAKAPADRFANGDALRTALDALSLDDVAFPLEQRTETEVFSSADAQQIWARAAELQANTGLVIPPAEFRIEKKSAAPETTGFNAAIVRSSAADAGIDARYVDRALAERAQATLAPQASGPVTSATIILGEAMKKRINPFLGARTKIEMETVIDGELSEFGFEEVNDEIQRALGEMVTVSVVGRTLTVTSAGGGGGRNHIARLQIHLTSRNGRTTVRAFEDLSQIAWAMFMGIGFGGTGGGGGMLAAIIMGNTQNGKLALAALGGLALLAIGLARTLFIRISRKREKALLSVLQRVVARATNSLEPAHTLPKLPGR